jgi:hypothetical protein
MRKQVWSEHTQRVLDEVQATIKAAYPEAEFKIYRGEDPPGIYIDAYTETDDGFRVLDLISDRLVDFSLTEEQGIHVIPLPKERAA